MNIRGLTKFSLVDFPGKICAIIFVGGCNFRCPYCHNPYLVIYHDSQPQISEEEVLDFLKTRIGKLDGVVISGGEPALYPNVVKFAKKIKELGFEIKFDTNGSNPELAIEMWENGLIDMFGIDYKTSESRYNEIALTNVPEIALKVKKLLKFVSQKNIPCDIRTTVHKKFHSKEILIQMRNELNEIGIKDWYIQQFHPVEIIDETLLEEDRYSDKELRSIVNELGPNTHLRGTSI